MGENPFANRKFQRYTQVKKKRKNFTLTISLINK